MIKMFCFLMFHTVAVVAAMGFEQAANLDEAKAMAKKLDKPLFIDFYAVWCGPCKLFDADSKKSDVMKAVLEKVVVVKIDAEKGDGPELFKSYGLNGYPSFLLADSEGRTIVSMVGYGGPESFAERLNRFLADPVPIATRQARFEQAPTAVDALYLADYHQYRFEQAEALAMFRKAREMDATVVADRAMDMFMLQAGIAEKDPEAFDQALSMVPAAMDTDEVKDKVGVAYTMVLLAQKHDRDKVMADFTRRGLTLTEGLDDEMSTFVRTALRINKALHLDDDPMTAFQLMRDTLPEGWQENGGQLNNFAWWCFENEVNLEEALAYAEKGARLSDPGANKAMVLDTVAEIQNAMGDPAAAIRNIKQAIEEHPESDYYPKQLKRFEGLLAKKTGT